MLIATGDNCWVTPRVKALPKAHRERPVQYIYR